VPSTVSIHAFREEGDDAEAEPDSEFDVSIHAFREEGDPRSIPH